MRHLITVLALFVALTAAAQSAASRAIELRAKIVDPSNTLSLLHPSVKREALPLYSETGLYLIQAHGRVSQQFRAAVAGVIGRRAILHYIPRDTLLVKASLADLEPLSAIPEVHWVGPYETEYKLSPTLTQLRSGDTRDPNGRLLLKPNVILASVDPECPSWTEDVEPCINSTVRTFEREPFFARKARRFAVSVHVVSNSTLRFECGGRAVPECIDFLIDWLAHRHEVTWLEAQPLVYGSVNVAVPSLFQPSEPYTDMATLRASTNFGLLTGQGQIVGMADTGIDLTSCFFSDTNPVGPAHRKVLKYIAYANDGDIFQGHGTAVAGCFVGNCLANASTSAYNGVVPDARIVVLDISNTTADPIVDYGGQPLTIPDNLYKIYTPMYEAGVRVMVDSWGGSPLSESTTSTQQLDEFAWNHRDFLDVRAAGNDGASYFSVSTQAIAKNVLSVGALSTTLTHFIETLDYLDLTPNIFYMRIKYCPINDTTCNITTEAQCCDATLQVVRDACCKTQIKQNILNKTAQYNTSIIASFSSKGPTRDQRVKPDVLAVGNRVITAMASGPTPYTTATPNPDSSMPNNLFTISGTSFSAPLMAGAATVVRQYFTDGWYPKGFPDPADAKVPSAALVKAMLITAATPVNLYVDSTGVQTATAGSLVGANFEGGFGKVALENVLYFGAASNFSILVLEGDVVTNQTRSLCFQLPLADCDAKLPQEITATLVWTDYPAFPAAVRQLVNDLDLVFIRSDKSGKERVFYGNRPYDTITLESTRDQLNNVERVTVNVTHCPSTFRVNVTGFDVPASCDSKNRNCLPQNFALVVRGPRGLSLASQCVECESDAKPLACAVDNGVGEKRCKGGRFTKCFVSACDKGYTINSYNNKCRAFLSYYVVVGIASGVFILITAFICIPIDLLYRCRRRGNSGSRGSDVNQVGFWEVFEVIEPRLFSMVIGSVCSLIGTSCSLIQPLFIADLFEQLQTVTQFSKIISLFYLIILFVVLEFIFSALGDFIIGVGTEGLLRHLRDRLYDGIIHRNYSELEGLDKGELRSRVMLDPQLVITFPSTALVVINSGLVKIVVGVILIFLISWSLSLVFLAVVPLLAVIAIVYAALIQPRITEQLDLLNATSAIANEGFSNLRVVKMYHKEDEESWRFLTANKRFYTRAMKNIILNDGANTIKSFIMQALAVGLLWYGSVLVIKPEITSGLLLAFFLYVGLAAAGVLSFSGVWPSYTTTLGALTRILELADQLNLAKARERAADKLTTYKRVKNLMAAAKNKSVRVTHRDPDRTTGAVGMENISFKYASFSDQWILKDLSMKFEIGKSHAIIGPSGAGKTSIFNLLTRLYEPNSGAITLDGIDIAGMSQEELLRYIGVVEQAPRVFHRSLWDNITYSKPDATADEVEEVCRLTNCSEFIAKMPNGFDTVIGEDSGEVLSGGQKQRLTLARALLKNPRILLLDEPTSELDVENAQIITDLILSTAKERTVIFITHSLATCRKADTIFFLQNGEVMESGSHDELMAKHGAYFNFIQISFAMAAENEDGNIDKKAKRAGRLLDLPEQTDKADGDLVTAQLLLASSPRFRQVATSQKFFPDEKDKMRTESKAGDDAKDKKEEVDKKRDEPNKKEKERARDSPNKREDPRDSKDRPARSSRGGEGARSSPGRPRDNRERRDDKDRERRDKSRRDGDREMDEI